MILPASCTLKGSPGPMPGAPALLRVDVLRPNVDEDSVPTPGLARLVRLNRWNISARNGRLMPSRIIVFFTTAASTVANAGPRNTLRCSGPRLPAGAGLNAADGNHCSCGAPELGGI